MTGVVGERMLDRRLGGLVYCWVFACSEVLCQLEVFVMRFMRFAVLIIVAVCASSLAAREAKSVSGRRMGPLGVHPGNGRYFQNRTTGEVVYLTGSHTWANLVDIGPKDPPPKFDFDACLEWMGKLNHNFIRLWTWELATWNTKANRENKVHTCRPQPWARTGKGKALDGKPKFDLKKFNPEYFGRLRKRITAARERGIYVSVMASKSQFSSRKYSSSGWRTKGRWACSIRQR